MTIVDGIILGVIEGVAEFLPISSTGHLIVASHFLGLPSSEENKAYIVIIQLAAVLAVITRYKERFGIKHIGLWMRVLVSFLPAAVIGLLFKDHIKALFSVEVVAWALIVGGVIFLLVERFHKPKTHFHGEIDAITFKQALGIGTAQLLAFIPGASRSGSTIIGGMFAGLSRKAAAEYSFLLALPVMGAASGYDMLKHYDTFAQTSFMPLAVGFVVSYVVALIAIKLFIDFVSKYTFNVFGIYRIILGGVLLYLL